MKPLTVPILIIAYRRASTTRQVINSLRPLRPTNLYFAANGPAPGNPNDSRLCAEVRNLTAEIDWDCQVHRLFRNEHLSAKHSIASAISWFFDNVEEGIILEDDCICDPSFFQLSQELLERYRDCPQVMQISATNFAPHLSGPDSYSYSGYAYIWGWASWRRAWQHFDLEMLSFDKEELRKVLARRFKRMTDRSYWFALFRYIQSGSLDTWDAQWNFCVFRQNGLCVVPRVNLVKNVGFGDGSTNTTSAGNPLGDMETESLAFPLVHPSDQKINAQADDWVGDHIFGIAKSCATLHMKMRIASMLSPQWKRKLKRMLNW